MRRVAVSRAVAFRTSGSSLNPSSRPPVARSVIRSSSSTAAVSRSTMPSGASISC